MNIVVLILMIVAAVLLYKGITLTAKRVAVYARLYRLKKGGKIKLKFTRNPFFSLFKISHAPDLVAEIGDKIYPMRFYNGIGTKHQVHFASKEYSASFRVVGLTVAADLGRALMGRGKGGKVGVGANGKVRIVPELKLPFEYSNLGGKAIVPIMIFAPAPSAISYVSEGKNSIKTAFTGDGFYGMTVFSGADACDFLLRESTREDVKIK